MTMLLAGEVRGGQQVTVSVVDGSLDLTVADLELCDVAFIDGDHGRAAGHPEQIGLGEPVARRALERTSRAGYWLAVTPPSM
jgi:hypothetical protein